MLKGLGQIGEMAKMMKAAKELQERMGVLQEELAITHLQAVSVGELVKVGITAKGSITRLELDPRLLVASEQAQSQALILATIQEAQAKAENYTKAAMGQLAASLGLPADMALPQ